MLLDPRAWLSRLFPRHALRGVSPPEAALERYYRERALATARVLLSVCGLAAIYLDPSEPDRFANLAYGLLVAFVAYSVLVLLLLQRRSTVTERFSWNVHGIEIAWAAVISLFTSGPNSPFFVFFVFVILAAAFRWRMRETVWTTAILTAVLLVQAVLFNLPATREWLTGTLDLDRLVMRAAYLLIMGFFCGFLGEKDKQVAEENAFIGDLIRRVRGELGFKDAIDFTLARVAGFFGASAALVILDDLRNQRALLVRRSPERCAWSEVTRPELASYLFPIGGSVAHLPPATSRLRPLVLDDAGRRSSSAALPRPALLPSDFLVADLLDGEWRARLILFAPQLADGQYKVARSLFRVVQNVGPALYNVLLVTRIRSQASALERARVAREIHDGSLQGLAAIELRLYALAQQARPLPDLARELEEVRKRVHNEALNLRDLMQQMRPLDLEPGQLLDVISDAAERLQRESGIAVQVVAEEAEDIDLPPRACRELARIVQEALVNVRRHSHAKNVLISLRRDAAGWELVLDDDGRGFDFAGEFSLAQLDDSRRGPIVIKDRVRALGAQLTLSSNPGAGTRLAIHVPLTLSARAHA